LSGICRKTESPYHEAVFGIDLGLEMGEERDMQVHTAVSPWWAALTVWGIVNAVNLLQAAGFVSRVLTGSMEVNHLLGRVMIGLAIPAVVTLVAFARAGAGWRYWIGPGVYVAFVALMIAVEYVWPVEFRSPMRYDILVPYLVLFFGAILWMGLPMFRMNRPLWLVTVGTTVLLLGSMAFAMSKGVG